MVVVAQRALAAATASIFRQVTSRGAVCVNVCTIMDCRHIMLEVKIFIWNNCFVNRRIHAWHMKVK
jgi:hypothetical protein